MPTSNESVEAHYTVTNLGDAILDALKSMGKDLDNLNPADLAPVDEFHVRGREATQELAKIAGVDSDTYVIDVGSGLGGSARYLAHEYGCRVTGLDLTQEFCDVAIMLSKRTGLDGMTEFRQGSALEMPFEDASFDLAWTEHTQMNIADKARFYSEIVRVLRPGGRLAFHDIFQGKKGDIRFPVPWANEPSISFLTPIDDLEKTLESAGLRILHWEDSTHRTFEWFQRFLENMSSQVHAPSPLGLHLVTGTERKVKTENLMRNLGENRIAVIQAVVEKV